MHKIAVDHRHCGRQRRRPDAHRQVQPAGHRVGTTATVTRWAAVVMFDATNWFDPTSMRVVADPWFVLPAGHENRTTLPHQPQLLSALRGPLALGGRLHRRPPPASRGGHAAARDQRAAAQRRAGELGVLPSRRPERLVGFQPRRPERDAHGDDALRPEPPAPAELCRRRRHVDLRGAQRPARRGQRPVHDHGHAGRQRPSPPMAGSRRFTAAATRSSPTGSIGGDHITASGGGGPSSPLVIYGDTTQDGAWYTGGEGAWYGGFGPKPYSGLPGGGTTCFVFGVGGAFRFPGNDVIDASALFGGAMPTVGIIAYGGPGDDLLIGSKRRRLPRRRLGQRRDRRPARQRPDLRRQRHHRRGRHAHAAGDLGEREPVAHPRRPRRRQRPALRRRAGQQREHARRVRRHHLRRLRRRRARTSTPGRPSARTATSATRTSRSGSRRSAASSTSHTLRPQDGGDDFIHGNGGRDRLFGGNGADRISGDHDANVIFGDHGHMAFFLGARQRDAHRS